MKKGDLFSLMAIAYCLISNRALAIEESIYDMKGDAPIKVILEKIGAPKDSTAPLTFKTGDREIKVEVQNEKERIVSIDFNPPYPFTTKEKDLFEKIETDETGDTVHSTLVISDPKTGRIWRLTRELTVSELELVTPWASKSKLSSLKEILSEMGKTKIEKNKREKKKVEIKK